MEKLIELLNEYRKEKGERSLNEYEVSQTLDSLNYLKLFIKWLVENDKIDRDEIIINSDFMPVAFDRKGEKYEWSEEKQLLMLLAIQDEPIEFLISILK